MIPTEPNVLYASAEKVKNGADATVVFTHDDGSQSTASFLSREFGKNNLNGTVAIIGNKIDEGSDDDAISSWASILDDANGRINFASHSYYHEYMGKTDDANTMYFNGVAREYPAGYITKTVASERARINGLFPNERMLAFVKPGVTKPDGESSQLSSETRAMIREHYIAMHDTDSVIDTYPPADFYQVRSMMAKQSSCGLTECNNAINQVINKKGLLVFLFHNITSTSSSDDKVAMQSDVAVMCENLGEQVASGKIWSAKFDEAMQYAKEYQSITSVKSTFDPTTEEVYVSVTDSVSKIDPDLKTGKFAGRDMYDYPITVKTEIPYDWDYVKLTQSYDNRTEIVKTFVGSG